MQDFLIFKENSRDKHIYANSYCKAKLKSVNNVFYFKISNLFNNLIIPSNNLIFDRNTRKLVKVDNINSDELVSLSVIKRVDVPYELLNI